MTVFKYIFCFFIFIEYKNTMYLRIMTDASVPKQLCMFMPHKRKMNDKFNSDTTHPKTM